MRLGRFIRPHLASVAGSIGVTEVVPVPSHWRTRAGRGFDPLRAILRGADVPVRVAARKSHYTRAQARSSRAQRRANLAGSFSLTRASRALTGRPVLLVDDVLTTGATVIELARLLDHQGCGPITVFAIARAEAS